MLVAYWTLARRSSQALHAVGVNGARTALGSLRSTADTLAHRYSPPRRAQNKGSSPPRLQQPIRIHLTMLRTLASRCSTASRRFLASRVVNIGSIEAYDKLSTTGDLVVTNYTAAWCGPCQAAAPVFDKMSEDHDDVIFCKVDIDDEDLGDLVAAAQVRAVPTYTFTKGGETVADNVQGADMEAIRDVLASQ